MATYSSVRHRRGRSQRRGEPRRPGQWKLAYADFLTALMAFFLLMWLSAGSSLIERSAIAAYFTGTEITGNMLESEASATDLETILATEIAANPVLSRFEDHIRVQARPDGLRIDLTDASSGSLFASGASDLNETGASILTNLARIITQMPFSLRIEGHTDAFKTVPGAPTNWELSSARAASALDALQADGIEASRFLSVTGLADTQPLLPTRPHAPSNRRISIVLELHP